MSVAGIADTNPVAVSVACRRFGLERGFADALRLIDVVEADGIVVATPLSSHVEIAAYALSRGLGVLLEKPVASTAAEARRLQSVAKDAKGFVLPGHVLRFSTEHRHLVEIAKSGRIGSVIYVNSRRYRDDAHVQRYPDIDPVLMTLIHDIDLAQWIAGSPFGSVKARRSGSRGARSMTIASIGMANGVICDLRTAWTFESSNDPPDCLEVVGERGSVELVAGQGLRIYADGLRSDVPLEPADDALRNEQDHFLACLRDRALTPALGLEEAIAGLELAEAVIKSLHSGRETGA